MAKVTRKALEQAVAQADYPADKEHLLARAEQQGADDEVLRALRSLQPVEYRNADEVLASVHPDITGGG